MALQYYSPPQIKVVRHELVKAGWIRRKDVIRLTRHQTYRMFGAMRIKQQNTERR
jgi:hypothetical protein